MKLGQTLKLESVLRGEVPTGLDQPSSHHKSVANSSIVASVSSSNAGHAWDPVCIFPNFRHEVLCGDTWANAHLVIGTTEGTFLIVHSRPPVSFLTGERFPSAFNPLQ